MLLRALPLPSLALLSVVSLAQESDPARAHVSEKDLSDNYTGEPASGSPAALSCQRACGHILVRH
jgi:hypothetical protein